MKDIKEKITEQSILLFEKKGFGLTTIQEIVDALNVTKGTFYYYFTSKEQLLMGIHLDYITNLLSRQKEILESSTESQREKLVQIIHLLITDIVDKGSSARVFFREIRHLDNENKNKIKGSRECFRKNIEKIVSEGIDNGEFRQNLRADLIAFGILGVTNWTYQWYKPSGEVSPNELAEMYAEMILTGLMV